MSDIISSLPEELQINILITLPIKDLVKVSEVSQYWRKIAYSDDVWRWKLYLLGFVLNGETLEAVKRENQTGRKICNYFDVWLNYGRFVEAYWNFSSPAYNDDNITDLSGHGHDGKLVGNASIKDGVLFCSGGGRVEIPNHSKLHASPFFTVEALVKPNKFDATIYENTIVSNHGYGTGWELRGNDVAQEFLISLTTLGHVEASLHSKKPLLCVDRWTRIVGMVNGIRSVQVLCEGQQAKAAAYTKTRRFTVRKLRQPELIHANESALLIGRNLYWESRHWEGEIAAVRICHIVLPPSLFLAEQPSAISLQKV